MPTTNHISLAPNRKTLETDNMFIELLLEKSLENFIQIAEH